MVVIIEITDRYIRTVSGSWGMGADGSWVFILNQHNAVRRMNIREGEKVAIVRRLVKEAYGSEYVGCELHMSYQWPDWMDIEGNFGGRTRLVLITLDETMSMYLTMRFDFKDLSLFVSKVNVEGGFNGEGSSNTTSYGPP